MGSRTERISRDLRRAIAIAMAGGVCQHTQMALKVVEMDDKELRLLVAMVQRRVRMILFEESGQETSRRVGDHDSK